MRLYYKYQVVLLFVNIDLQSKIYESLKEPEQCGVECMDQSSKSDRR